MKRFYQIGLSIILFTALTSCNGQTKNDNQTPPDSTANKTRLVGGGCDGCEIMFVGMPKNISSVDTSVGWTEKGQKLLVTGKVYKIDGKTPAPNVIIYYWHTDNNGYY
ncbi:MAG: hypothetical protein ABI091_25595, partial [Ferruginibacter sp.]